jgi:hypothetical protein
VGNKILMIEPNYAYRAVNGDAAEKRAVTQSFAQSTIWGFTVTAESGGEVLVDATDFLLRDAMQVSNTLQNSKQGTYALDATRSAMYLSRTKNFPLNTEFEATVTFVNKDGRPGNYVASVTPAADAITPLCSCQTVTISHGYTMPALLSSPNRILITAHP